MIKFFAINVDKFVGPGQKQLQVLGASVDKKMQIVWAAPSVKSVTMLERVQHLITPMVKYLSCTYTLCQDSIVLTGESA
jgi:hypothetical protein